MRNFVRALAAGAAAVMLCCGGGSSGGDSSAITTSLTNCDPTTQRAGTYLVSFQLDSGNCGALADQTVILNAMTMANAASTCSVLTSTWSDGNCRNDVELQCSGGIRETGYTVQQAQDGSSLTGRVTFDTTSCSGTYDVRYTRQ